MTHWVLQNNLYSEDGWDALTSTLDRFGYSYSVHKCVPFVGTLEPEASPPQGPVIVMGSYTMARHAKDRGWTPGAWLGNLDYRIQQDHWGDFMLNADATYATVKTLNVDFAVDPFFVRPVHDTKSFTGRVFDRVEWQEFQDGILRVESESPTLTGKTEIMVCPKKEIWSETRTWVIDRKVVTASGYKLGTLKRYSPPEDVDPRITQFAQLLADVWSPNDAYVMDIADTPNGLRIVEVNNLNSAGFYKADMQKLVQALEELVSHEV